MIYTLTEEDVIALAEKVKEKMLDKARKSGDQLAFSAAGEAAYQMIRHHIPKLAAKNE